MVKDMRSRMSLLVAELGLSSRKEGRAEILIGEIDISRLMIYVQYVEHEKIMDSQEYRNIKTKTGNYFG